MNNKQKENVTLCLFREKIEYSEYHRKVLKRKKVFILELKLLEYLKFSVKKFSTRKAVKKRIFFGRCDSVLHNPIMLISNTVINEWTLSDRLPFKKNFT